MEDLMGRFRLEKRLEVTSTNDIVKEAIRNGASEGYAICAKRQTAGYGRRGHVWSSPEGGLYLSVLLRPAIHGIHASRLTTLGLLVSIAVKRTLCSLCDDSQGSFIRIKWPNDVVFSKDEVSSDEKLAYSKLCGISVEAIGDAVCIGIGINIFRADDSVADDSLPSFTDRPKAYIEDMMSEGVSISIDDVLVELLGQLDKQYSKWIEESFSSFVDEYNQSLILCGHRVSVECLDNKKGIVDGVVIGVDASARLLLQTNDYGEEGVLAVVANEAHIL